MTMAAASVGLWRLVASLVLLAVAASLPSPLRAEELNVGTVGASSDAPFFIADKKGYFKDEGLSVNFIRFDSAAKMVAPLGTGELDVGGGATSAGLYNAVERGIDIKIVADKARNARGYGFQALMVRKDLIDSGKFKSYKDLKGLRVATSAVGNSESSVLNEALKLGGLTLADVEQTYIGFPQHPAAFANGAIDASITTEPTISFILRAGTAVRFAGVDEFFPNHQTAVIYYGAVFIAKKPEAARRFIRALVRGMRFYNGALEGGHLAGPNADEVISILTEYSNIKDPAIYRAIISQACDPDGNLDLPSLRKDWQFFKDTGEIDGSVTVDDVIDQRFVKEAVASLGPYRGPSQSH
jgi:NitT/TauT family transport system substrate-binding protein